MNKLEKYFVWILFPLLLNACGGGGGGGDVDSENNKIVEEESTSPTNGNTELELSAFDMPTSAQANSNTQVNFNVNAEAEGLVTYRFDSIFADFHFKPNSGVIALQNNTGQVRTQYLAPRSPGTYHYTLQLIDSQGLTIEHVFEVQVN